MKNKNEESIFKKKGFFISLYSSLGAVIVLAVVISFSNLMTGPGDNNGNADAEQNESLSVAADNVESYLVKAGEMAEQDESDDTAWKKPTPPPTPPPTVKPTPPPSQAQPPVAPAYSPPPAQPPESPEVNPPPAPDNVSSEAQTGETPVELTFEPFSENDRLIWPVTGEIAMAFSMDKLVYDPTLDQYRANDDLRISAREGTPVKACADGKVTEIGENREYGNYITVDHGNGYEATYGQLMDNMLVKEGEIIKGGQVIGGVGKPSVFGSLNGTHVNLRLTREDEPIDPYSLLADLN